MINMVIIELTDYHKFSSGQTCLIGTANPKEHKLITSNCIAKIIVDDELEIPLKIIGQDINVRNDNNIKNDQTFLRTEDDLDEVLKYIGKKRLRIIVAYPDRKNQ